MQLPFNVNSFPTDGQNAFGGIRKYDIHTGIDFFCDAGQIVHAIECGVVVNVLPFTGELAGSPWWNNTQAVMIEGQSGVFLYGEIETSLRIGDDVIEGQIVGNVIRVLKVDKGLPTTMLHLELYKHGCRDCVWWKLGEEQPISLLNPTDILNLTRF